MSVRRTVSMTLCLAAACAAAPLHAGPRPAPAGPVRIGDAFLARLVGYAIAGASDRFAQPGCQSLLGEFTDQEGRPLADNLAALGHDGSSFLNRLLIYDAGDHQLCRTRGVLAITHPGSRVVLVCGDIFRLAYLRDPTLAEAVIIHEALHSLGLGENPPSSQEITSRVLDRCRRRGKAT